MEIWARTSRRIFDKIYGNNIENIYDILSHRISDNKNLEFEMRISDLHGNCSLKYWNVYNEYFRESPEFLDDLIITYENPFITVNGNTFREYYVGGVKQEKTLITKFATSTPDKFTIPLMTKLSIERYIENLGDIQKYPKNYARTFRQSYTIDCDLISKRSRKYISNWRVDKTVRLIYSKFPKNYIEKIDISNPQNFDILDLEFEYIGDFKDLEFSLISLFEFLYLSHPIMRTQYFDISFDYNIYSILSGDKLKSFKPTLKIKGSDLHRNKLSIPEDSELKILIYDNDENYIEVENDRIIFDYFDGFNLYNYSIIPVFKYGNKYICFDCYCYEKELIFMKNYEIRFECLKRLCDSSKKLKINFNHKKPYFTIYLYNNFQDIRISPNTYYIDLFVEKCLDNTYILYTQNSNLLISPLLNINIYIPGNRNDFDRDIRDRKIFIDKTCVKFKCELNYGYLDLVPVSKSSRVSEIDEVSNVLLEAYSKFNNITEYKENDVDVVDLLFQVIIEKFNFDKFTNILMLDEYGMINPFASKIINLFISADRIILKSKSKNIVENLYAYYSPIFIPPIKFTTTKYRKMSSKHFYTINENNSIFNIPGIYSNDIDLLITPYQQIRNLSMFIDLFENMKKNLNFDGVAIFNYINRIIDLYSFIYDIDISTDEKVDVTDEKFRDVNMYIDLSSVTEKDELRKKVSNILKKRNHQKITLIRTNRSINSRLLELVHKSDTYLYKYSKYEETNLLKKYLIDILRTSEDEEIKNNVVLFMIKNLSKYINFNIKIYYPSDTKEIVEKLAFDKNFRNNSSLTDLDYLHEYISVEIRF